MICHFWTLWDLQCICYQVDTPWLHGHVWVAAAQQLQCQWQKATCLMWGCSLLLVYSCWVYNTQLDLPEVGGAINICFLCMMMEKAKQRKAVVKMGVLYISHSLCWLIILCHLEKFKFVDLWLKCIAGVGVLLVKSLKWGLLLREGRSCPVHYVASPIPLHV